MYQKGVTMKKLSKDLVKKLVYKALNEENKKLTKEAIKTIVQDEVRSHYGDKK